MAIQNIYKNFISKYANYYLLVVDLSTGLQANVTTRNLSQIDPKGYLKLDSEASITLVGESTKRYGYILAPTPGQLPKLENTSGDIGQTVDDSTAKLSPLQVTAGVVYAVGIKEDGTLIDTEGAVLDIGGGGGSGLSLTSEQITSGATGAVGVSPSGAMYDLDGLLIEAGVGPKGDKGDKGDPGEPGTPGTPGEPGTPGAIYPEFTAKGDLISYDGAGPVIIPTGNRGYVAVCDGDSTVPGGFGWYDPKGLGIYVSHQVACSDMTTDLTSGTRKAYFRVPHKMTLDSVRASLASASTSGTVEVNIKKAGVSILSTNITLDSGVLTSLMSAVQPDLSESTLEEDDEISIDIITPGNGAKGLIITLIGSLITW